MVYNSDENEYAYSQISLRNRTIPNPCNPPVHIFNFRCSISPRGTSYPEFLLVCTPLFLTKDTDISLYKQNHITCIFLQLVFTSKLYLGF